MVHNPVFVAVISHADVRPRVHCSVAVRWLYIMLCAYYIQHSSVEN